MSWKRPGLGFPRPSPWAVVHHEPCQEGTGQPLLIVRKETIRHCPITLPKQGDVNALPTAASPPIVRRLGFERWISGVPGTVSNRCPMSSTFQVGLGPQPAYPKRKGSVQGLCPWQYPQAGGYPGREISGNPPRVLSILGGTAVEDKTGLWFNCPQCNGGKRSGGTGKFSLRRISPTSRVGWGRLITQVPCAFVIVRAE